MVNQALEQRAIDPSFTPKNLRKCAERRIGFSQEARYALPSLWDGEVEGPGAAFESPPGGTWSALMGALALLLTTSLAVLADSSLAAPPGNGSPDFLLPVG